MKKMLYLFALLSLSVHGQTTTTAKINSDIRNVKTSKHINIPGTRLYIIPPPGFKIASTFTGLQKGETSMFNIIDLAGGNINTNASTFNKAEFEKKGIKVFDFREIKINGFAAKYIYLQGEANSKAYLVVFGDTTFTTMVTTLYPVNDDKTGNEIISSLNTIYYDKNKKFDPFETAKFTLDDKVSKFKYFQYNANLYLYTIDGKDNSKDSVAPIVLLVQVPMDKNISVKGLVDMFISKMQQNGLSDSEVKNTSAEKINGYDAYQTELYGQMNGKANLIYYCVLANDNIAIVIQGIAKNDFETNVGEFRKMANNLRLK